ncbi:hypothetical protein G6F64_000373 [Rhizopus arrhizus]|uniref:Uncharacterized protein n=1 Tax=Rhizopus oryzae TaxID=64495 RepID=A0A9P7BYB1_RHIOR|nr:hypothetical protein G6F64_000373 [Rhizopus arrhizus]
MSPDLADFNTAPPVIIETVYWVHLNTRILSVPNYVGLVVHKLSSNRYLEVNFDNDELRTIACIHGLHFDYGQVIIRPALACRPSSIIRRATLQPLPWLLPHNLQEGLRRTLSNYGSIRDVGIVTDSETGAFFGSDYAVLDCSPGHSQSFDGF